MTSIVQSLVSVLLGLALAAYGLVHTVTRYPDPVVFAQVASDLPTLGAVLMFGLGVVATAAGISVLVLSLRRLRRSWRHLRAVTNSRAVSATRGYGDEAEGPEWAGAYR